MCPLESRSHHFLEGNNQWAGVKAAFVPCLILNLNVLDFDALATKHEFKQAKKSEC